jgi:hypothetical protein
MQMLCHAMPRHATLCHAAQAALDAFGSSPLSAADPGGAPPFPPAAPFGASSAAFPDAAPGLAAAEADASLPAGMLEVEPLD